MTEPATDDTGGRRVEEGDAAEADRPRTWGDRPARERRGYGGREAGDRRGPGRVRGEGEDSREGYGSPRRTEVDRTEGDWRKAGPPAGSDAPAAFSRAPRRDGGRRSFSMPLWDGQLAKSTL